MWLMRRDLEEREERNRRAFPRKAPFPPPVKFRSIVDGLAGLGHELDKFLADGDMRGVFGIGLEPSASSCVVMRITLTGMVQVGRKS